MRMKHGIICGVIVVLMAYPFGARAEQYSKPACLETTRASLAKAEKDGKGLTAARAEFIECARKARVALVSWQSAASVETVTTSDFDTPPNDGGITLPQSASLGELRVLAQGLEARQLQTKAVSTAIENALEVAAAEDKVEDITQDEENEEKFLGFNWGLGVGASFGLGADRIESAELVNGVVRVSEEVTNTPRIVLEVHNFWKREDGQDRSFGHGPFAAINFGASDADTLSAFGAGYMWGVKRKDSSSSFNIGVGLMLDRGVQQLGDNIENGKALPEGETDIRFKKESELAALLFVSTTF